jgi:2-furoate---CoA ligase
VTLRELLERAALRHPRAEAVVDGQVRLTYGALDEQATAVGRGLLGLGVGRGDRVVLVLRNRIEHVLTYWALQKIAAVPVPVNFRLSASDLAYVIEDAGARAVLFEEVSAAAVADAARGRDVALVYVGGPPPAGARAFVDLAVSPTADLPAPAQHDISLILYTSGTTGRPKGVPRSHGNHAAGALAHVIQCGYEWGERTLGVMPLYHTMGIHALTSMAAVNGCFVCQPQFTASGALQLIRDERLTALYLIPTLFYDLLHAPDFVTADVTSVRKLAYAGAPMLAALTEACWKAWTPRVFVNHYGSTEIYTFTVRPEAHAKPGCAGRPGIHSTVRVVTASAERRAGPGDTVAPGVKGEIIARLDSDEAFAGYWNRPDADARALRDGWYFTGDMGWIDDDGELWVAGRVDDMIISGGENIHPVEIEEALARHPEVRDVAVVGEPDERWGERVVAFVVPVDRSLAVEDLDRWCRESGALAAFKRPRRVVLVEEIPKTPSGKILRRLLREGRYREIGA